MLERERKENGSNRGTGEPREEQIAPRLTVDFAKLAQVRKKQWQKHDQDQNVLPEDNDLGIE